MSVTTVETSFRPNPITPIQSSSPASSSGRDGSWPTNKNSSARLLYRGALSLPDSELLLDGLTFVLNTPLDDTKASRMLLESPLPLALESMRGRPSLSFVGVVKMDDVYCDFNVTVNLYIHPRCILTRQLFAHNLCAVPVDPSNGRTDKAIRIRLGDDDATVSATDPGDIVVYGRPPHPSSSVMQLCVARILNRPPGDGQRQSAAKRPPRPDDPTPRKPPSTAVAVTRIGLGAKQLRQSLKEKGKEKEKEKEKAKEEGTAGPSKKPRKERETANLGKNARVSLQDDAGVFKVPALPASKKKGKSVTFLSLLNDDDPDIFEISSQCVSEGTSDTEAQNKLFIKKAAVRLVSAIGVGKQHPDFKEYFNHVYRGVLYALRSKMKSHLLETNPKDAELVDRIVQTHVTLYQGGKGLGVHMLQS